jgi:Pvc16 N-terminal domain
MLHLLDETLEAFLREQVPLPARQVDVSFSAPDQDWGAKVSRPTVNLFLWDIRQNLAERVAGWELVEEDGRRYRRTPPPRIDCRYLVTAWTSDVSDEHQLLGALLTAFLGRPEIPAGYLRGPLEQVFPRPSISVASPAETTSSDFWSALGGKLKPGLDLVVTLAIDAAAMTETGPAAKQYQLRLRRQPTGVDAGGGRLVGGHVDAAREGSVVSGPRGTGVVQASGEFTVTAEHGDPISVSDEASGRELKGVVPEAGTIELAEDSVEANQEARQPTVRKPRQR